MASEKSQPKRELRRTVRESIRANPPGDGAAVRMEVAAWLENRPDLRVIASYAAMPDEVDLLPLVAMFPDRRWVFPRVVGDDLALHHVADTVRDLAAGAFGIREPLAMAPVVPAGDVDVFLCPGLAFDPRGGRLGRGRGFYDRLLAPARPTALRIGVCHPLQRVADTYPEPHDVPMHRVFDGGGAQGKRI